MSNRNLDKLVSGLNERLGKLWPTDDSNGDSDSDGSSRYYSNYNNNNNDGVHFWRGKKIIDSSEWLKISKAKTSPGSVEETLEGLQFFPDTYIDYLWMLGIPHGEEESITSELIIEQKVYAWYDDYIELMVYKRDPGYEKFLNGKELTRAPPYCSDDFNAIGMAWFPRVYGAPGESERRIRIRHELGF